MKMTFFLLVTVFFGFSIESYSRENKLKDLVTVKGVRENPIIGYGLVIGLNGTGDGGGEITNTSLLRMFQKLGLNPKQELASKNVAAVVITANLPPFARIGQKVDVHVSSIGDSGSLAGGTLLVAPLKGGDGQVYAVASGQLSVGGLKGSKFTTAGIIPDGAIVEKEIELNFDQKKSLRLSLVNADFTTAARIEKIINENLGGRFAIARDATTVDLIVPASYERNIVQLMAVIENFSVNADSKAKIVINERTGTIVAGGDIQVMPVAIAHGDLTIEIGQGGGGKASDASKEALYLMDKGTTLSELVKGLNALGVKPDDLISIFQALKRNGSLVGEIELI